MAQEKKFVESITDMEVDFPQWSKSIYKNTEQWRHSEIQKSPDSAIYTETGLLTGATRI